MRACGLIVEYNPFHNGHLYHIEAAKKASNAECIIAVMSGNFLQRGEPAIIDKFHRAKAALDSGVDIVLELPYPFAVQNSDLFAHGAVHTLNEIGVSSICFGSESGEITPFITGYENLNINEKSYKLELKKHLETGLSFPEASMLAYQKIGLATEQFDLSQPNNVLGFSYVKTILQDQLDIEALTIKRHNNHYHDTEITNQIASATSIRKEILSESMLTPNATAALPSTTLEQLQVYKNEARIWHDWEHYFPLLNYRVRTMSHEELRQIHGIDEGLEYRVKKTANTAVSMADWISAIKTKRYTWTRIQRMFVHILTNYKKIDMETLVGNSKRLPYLRILGMTKTGQQFLNKQKKTLEVPIITGMSKNMDPMLALEERATNAYYSVLSPAARMKLIKQEITGPIFV